MDKLLEILKDQQQNCAIPCLRPLTKVLNDLAMENLAAAFTPLLFTTVRLALDNLRTLKEPRLCQLLMPLSEKQTDWLK